MAEAAPVVGIIEVLIKWLTPTRCNLHYLQKIPDIEVTTTPSITVTSDTIMSTDMNSGTNTSAQQMPTVDQADQIAKLNKKLERLRSKYDKLKAKYKAIDDDARPRSMSTSTRSSYRTLPRDDELHRSSSRTLTRDNEEHRSSHRTLPRDNEEHRSSHRTLPREGEERKLRVSESARRISAESSKRISNDHRKSITTKDIEEGKFKLEEFNGGDKDKKLSRQTSVYMADSSSKPSPREREKSSREKSPRDVRERSHSHVDKSPRAEEQERESMYSTVSAMRLVLPNL